MLYPKLALELALRKSPALTRRMWKALNDIPAENLLREGRVYGGGLYKMEPRELANAVVPGIRPELIGVQTQPQLFDTA
jgi:hypothetical protein